MTATALLLTRTFRVREKKKKTKKKKMMMMMLLLLLMMMMMMMMMKKEELRHEPQASPLTVKNAAGADVDVDQLVGDGDVVLAVLLAVGEVDVWHPEPADAVVAQSGQALRVRGVEHQARVCPLLAEVQRRRPRLCAGHNHKQTVLVYGGGKTECRTQP